MPVTQPPLLQEEAQDFSAQLQERIRAFTSFYEQHAYLAYNLALRIACEPEPAMQAVQRAFLTQLDSRPPGLLPATVRAALEAARSHPEPGGAGDSDAEMLIAVTASLPPPERAALALADLAHGGGEEIGSALGLPGDQGAKLLHRAREGFAARLGVPRPQADEAAASWMWAAPPLQIWEELYPQFHRTVERDLRRGSQELTLVLMPGELPTESQPGPISSRRLPRITLRRRRRSGRRWPRWGVVGVALLILGLGGAGAARLTGGAASTRPGGSHPAASPDGGIPPAGGVAGQPAPTGGAVQTHKPLTPGELDKLRLRELNQLNEYTRRQANRQLPPSKRLAAAKGIADLQRAADQRLRAELKREQVLRDQLARERARAKAPPPPPPPVTSRPSNPPPRTQPPRNQSTAPTRAPKRRPSASQTCLYNQDTGQYVCPQQ